MAAPGALRGPSRCARGRLPLTWSLLGLLYLGGSALPPPPAQVRLAGGARRCEGQVQVALNGTWAHLCEPGWGLPEAQVTCAQVRCGRALAVPGGSRFGPALGSTWPAGVRCQGSEAALGECQVRALGNLTCPPGGAAAVLCAGEHPEEGQVRLAGGPHRCAGRVELFHAGRWGTVCDDSWDVADAQVTCRQVRCGPALWAPGGAQFGRGSGVIWLDETNCTGTEAQLAQCPARTWGRNDCYHGEDAGAVCADSLLPEPPHLRLAGGSHRCAGRVELPHLGTWGGVCAHTWGPREAQVVCRHLGCGTALPAPPVPAPAATPGQVWLEQVSCDGSESDLSQCRAGPWRESGCAEGGVANVVCSGSALSNHTQVRLSGGPGACAGRVEVLHAGTWGSVCDDTWAFAAAAVVCRYLGCGQVIAAPPRARFGPGQGPVWLDGLTCTGAEGALDECHHKGWGVHTCEHSEDAGVVCSGSGLADLAHLRLAEGPHRCAGRVQVLHEGRWGGVCAHTWHLAAAQVSCRQLGCGPALEASKVSAAGEELTWVEAVRCNGTEGNLLECQVQVWGAPRCPHATVTCAAPGEHPEEGQVRLAGGPHRCAGRVEIFHAGRWGTVCDDSWDVADAQVTCRQVRCGPALWAPGGAQFGEGAGPIWLDGLRCAGTEEHLAQCPARPWGQHTCNHVEDASAICSGSGLSAVPQVRLSGAPDRCAGRVEVLHQHLWGTVCDDTWDLRHARVICRQLGCGAALEAPGAARYGRGTGPIWLDDVTCVGNERDLFQCPARTWGQHNCHHGEDASVVCAGNFSSGELRLVGGPHLCAGRVEVLHEGQWGTVCNDGWDMRDAQVVCRQLGCGAALAAPGFSHFGAASGQVWLDEVTCAGRERHLAQCPALAWGTNSCQHGEDAGVVCAVPSSAAPRTPGHEEEEEPFQVRLAGGPGRCAGRVEVLHLGRWGTVCDDGWDLEDARVTCRQLGCGAAVSAPGSARFGPGTDPIWLDEVQCTGEELTLARCGHRPWGRHSCRHREDASVVCAGADPPQVRLRGGPGPCAGQVQVLHNRTWHQVCGQGWALPEAQVVCRQVGCGPALSAPVGPPLPAGGRWLLQGLTCEGSESQLLECLRRETAPGGTCGAGGAAGVACAMPAGASPSCAYLVALLLLLTSLSGALLWLTLRARCATAHLDAPRAPGAIYLPRRAPPGEADALQLMDDAP